MLRDPSGVKGRRCSATMRRRHPTCCMGERKHGMTRPRRASAADPPASVALAPHDATRNDLLVSWCGEGTSAERRSRGAGRKAQGAQGMRPTPQRFGRVTSRCFKASERATARFRRSERLIRFRRIRGRRVSSGRVNPCRIGALSKTARSLRRPIARAVTPAENGNSTLPCAGDTVACVPVDRPHDPRNITIEHGELATAFRGAHS